MRRVLVTWAAGFIGSSLVDALLARGDEVVGTDDFNDYYSPSVKRRNIESALDTARYSMREGDIDEYTFRNCERFGPGTSKVLYGGSGALIEGNTGFDFDDHGAAHVRKLGDKYE